MREQANSAGEARLTDAPRARLPIVALLLWALLAFAIPALSQPLNIVDIFALPLGYFMVAQGSLIGFVIVGWASARWQDRREARAERDR